MHVRAETRKVRVRLVKGNYGKQMKENSA